MHEIPITAATVDDLIRDSESGRYGVVTGTSDLPGEIDGATEVFVRWDGEQASDMLDVLTGEADNIWVVRHRL